MGNMSNVSFTDKTLPAFPNSEPRGLSKNALPDGKTPPTNSDEVLDGGTSPGGTMKRWDSSSTPPSNVGSIAPSGTQIHISKQNFIPVSRLNGPGGYAFAEAAVFPPGKAMLIAKKDIFDSVGTDLDIVEHLADVVLNQVIMYPVDPMRPPVPCLHEPSPRADSFEYIAGYQSLKQ